jgi:ATP-dependent Clp protease protease subunit
MDIFSRLLRERIIYLGTPIDDHIAGLIISQLLYLEHEDSSKDIFLYINSPGGYVTAGLAIYDTMQYIKANVTTVCMGLCASMGAIILAGGEKGKRFALPSSKIMIHQPLGGMQGQASDIEIEANEMKKTKAKLYDILSKHTNQPFEVVEKACDRNNYMTPLEAKEWGIIDDIMEKR